MTQCFLWVVIFLTTWVEVVHSQIPKNLEPLPQPYYLKAKRVIFERAKRLYIAEGDVKIDQANRHLEADFVCIDLKQQKATLKGSVLFRIGNDDWIRASEAKIDLKTYQGTLYGAKLFASENHMYVSSDEIAKTGENTYFVKNATITSCDGEVPTWRFTVKRLNVEIEGWASAHNVAFWVKSFPLVYVPYLTLPIKTKRKTGFLFPYFSYSKRDGFDITVPFFWAIKENMDATFYQRYMTKRGFMQGIEYRYLLSEDKKGIFFFDFLSDRRGDIDFLWDEISRTNKLRWWIRSKQEHLLPYGFYYQLDLDLVSDQDYLREFTEGYNNYAACDKDFLKYFGRGFLNEEASLIRQSDLSLTKYWGIYDFVFEMKYNQNLDKRVDEYTLQQLPYVHFYRNDAPLLHTPIYLSLDTHYTYFFRQKSKKGPAKGHRTHLEPTLSLPFTFHYLDFLPKITLKETVYNLKGHSYSRFLYYTSLEAKTDLWRLFRWPIRTLHHLEPRLVYEFQPQVNQEKLPYFDGLDRLPKINRLTYSLTNYFIRKEREWLWFKVSQTYDINEQRRRLTSGEKRRPFSDILIETQFRPWPYTYLDSEISISPYGKGVTYTHTHLDLKDWRKDSIRLDYQYREGQTNDLSTGCYINLAPGWQAYVEDQHSFMYHRDIEARVGIRYNAPCWGIELAYSDTFENRRALVIFSLRGIGEIKLGR